MISIFRPSGPLAQYAALPVRRHGETLSIGLVTSLTTKRWIIPKGWPKPGVDPWQTAAQEAQQEAGWYGEIETRPLGTFSYEKRLHMLACAQCDVEVFVLHVAGQRRKWREQGRREIAWFSATDAATMVSDDGLAKLINEFASVSTAA